MPRLQCRPPCLPPPLPPLLALATILTTSVLAIIAVSVMLATVAILAAGKVATAMPSQSAVCVVRLNVVVVAAVGVIGLILAALDFVVDHRKVSEVVMQDRLQGGEPDLNASQSRKCRVELLLIRVQDRMNY